MITDQETNFVYFSGLFKQKFEHEYSEITSILAKHRLASTLYLKQKIFGAEITCRFKFRKIEFIEYQI